MVRFLHSADWQIGKPYARVPDPEKRARLKQVRLEAIARLGAVAMAEQVAFVLVAGDLFDSIGPTRAEVAQACSAIGAIPLPVLVIPGNHDHGGPGSLWQEPWFLAVQRELAPNLQVLLERKPLQLAQALLLPCPLLRQAEPLDPTAWVRQLDLDRYGDLPRLLLAHGSVQGFGGEEAGDGDGENPAVAANRIDLSALPLGELDYIALGDWHGLKQVGPKAWYAGCHEQDRFPRSEGYRSGQALRVEVQRGQLPQVTAHGTGAVSWQQLHQRFNDDSDLACLEQQLADCLGSRSGNDLLLLELEGSLSLEAAAKLQSLLQRLGDRLLRLKLRDRTSVAPNELELKQLTERPGDPLVARVAQRLQALAASTGEEADLARLALRELHGACLGRS